MCLICGGRCLICDVPSVYIILTRDGTVRMFSCEEHYGEVRSRARKRIEMMEAASWN